LRKHTSVRFYLCTIGRFLFTCFIVDNNCSLLAKHDPIYTFLHSSRQENKRFGFDLPFFSKPSAHDRMIENGVNIFPDGLNVLFGKSVFDTNYDPSITQGWGNRAYNWDFGATVQHEVIPRLSATVGYFRRVYGNFLVTDNLALAPSDYNSFSIPVPADARLPGGAARCGHVPDPRHYAHGEDLQRNKE